MNLNRDYLVILSVKTSEIAIDRPIEFYTTDKQTMNIFVKVMIDLSDNIFIKDYIALEKASDYGLSMILIAPNNETFYLEGLLMDEQESLYMFNLGEEFVDKVGEWVCELRVRTTVNGSEEITTSNRFSYIVKGSITHDLDDDVYDTEDLDIISNIAERLAVVELTDGLPIGGNSGQVLAKKSNISGDVHWVDTNSKIDLNGYATEKYVDNAVANIDVSDQLVDYALRTDIPSVPTKTSQLTNDSGYITNIPSEYITESELNAKNYLTSIPSEYITESELNAKNYLTSIPSEYITENELDRMGYLTSIPSEYITENELDAKGYLTDIPSEYVTDSELNSKGYLTQHQDLSAYAKKTELPTISNDLTNTLKYNYDSAYKHSTSAHAPINAQKNADITKAEIEAKLTGVVSSHSHSQYLTNVPTEYITESQLNARGYISTIPSEYVTESELDSKGYLKYIPAEYVTDDELTAKKYATETYVTNAIANAELGGEEIDLSGYALKTDLHSHSNKSIIDNITSSNVSNWGSAYTHSTSTHAPTNAQKNSDITKTEIENKLTGNITTHTHNQYLTEHQSLTDYAKKSEIPTVPTNVGAFTNDKGYITSIPSEYVTESELNSKGYLTQHQDLSAYAKKTDLPTVPTNVSAFTNDSGYLTSIPSEYITESELASEIEEINSILNAIDTIVSEINEVLQ